MAERILSRDELKHAILWCARMLVTYTGQPYAGPLSVSIRLPEESEANTIKPKGTTDGVAPPCWFDLRGEDGEGGADGVGAEVSASELLRVLLSPDERELMLDLVTNQPCSASSVQDRCKAQIKKSEFWAVWGQLQQRQLVEETDDGRYQVGPEWLARWLRARREGDRPAA